MRPNYSFKRTVQSLRDWSCRLAHALGLWFKRVRSSLPAPCSTSHADRRGRRACRFQRRRITGSFVPRGRRHETSGTHQRGTSQRDSRRGWGRGVLALPCRSGSGSLGLTIRSSGRPNRFAFGPPLSSGVRRRKSACSLGVVAPRSRSAFRGANVGAAVRLPSRREMPVCYFTAVLRHHRFRAAWSAGMGIVGWQAATNFAGCQFGPCSIRRERQPNNSLKRTVQSLRDWSCRLAQSLARNVFFSRTDSFHC